MIKNGIPASPGVIFGRAYIFNTKAYRKNIIKRTLSDTEIKAEIQRFEVAIEKTKKELKAVHKRVLMEIGEKHASLFYAYTLILEDRLFKEGIISNIEQGMNAEYALQKVVINIEKTFSNIEDVYLKERERDIEDVVAKIVNNLNASVEQATRNIKPGSIIIAHKLTPADTMSMKGQNTLAFLTDIGGRTSHTSIFAQALQIPAVVGMHNITEVVNEGDFLIVDGYKGIVVINPSEDEVLNYKQEKARLEDLDRELDKLRNIPATTKDGLEIKLQANIEIPEEIDTVLMHGSRGVGLYRTEFLYLNHEEFPKEEEQFDRYKYVVERMMPYSVTIRTMDLGGDKFLEKIEGLNERNPFLGLRGIRFSLKYKDIFKTQLRAILRASAFGKIKIMYPMICSLEEFLEANEVLEEVKDELNQKNIVFDKNMEVGAMIEVPSAVCTVDIISEYADFFSIGTNDLIQYSFAVDRANENVSDLYKPHHIAILRMLKIAKDKLENKEVSICGEISSDMKLVKVLIGLGFKSLSMNAAFIPKIKEVIINTTYQDCQDLAKKALNAKSEKEVLDLLTFQV
ncbi:MAG: phosphoenolpyruvate--protein phosphotransferase [bacterium]|nr:phosphoenolpyruvate--protein phosphotransferase [bacterium]